MEAVGCARDLELLDRHVFFNDDWVPYDERQNYLLDADLGVSTHFEHVETAFSFRTRVLDYFWAGLPVVTTEGDALSTVVNERGLGLTVPVEDVEALADALHVMLTDDELISACRRNLKSVRDEYGWEQTLRPLLEFCRRPARAADERYLRREADADTATAARRAGYACAVALARSTSRRRGCQAMLREGGVHRLAKQTAIRFKRLARGFDMTDTPAAAHFRTSPSRA